MYENRIKLEELGNDELLQIKGGVIGSAVALAFGVLGGVCLLAYGAGYVYGKLTCDCE